MTTDTQTAAIAAPSISPWRSFWSDFCSSSLAVFSLLTFILIVLIAIFAPWISPQNPFDLAQVDVMDSRLPPGSESFTGMVFWLGTDGAGVEYKGGSAVYRYDGAAVVAPSGKAEVVTRHLDLDMYSPFPSLT